MALESLWSAINKLNTSNVEQNSCILEQRCAPNNSNEQRGTEALMLVEFHNSRSPSTTARYPLWRGLTDLVILKYGNARISSIPWKRILLRGASTSTVSIHKFPPSHTHTHTWYEGVDRWSEMDSSCRTTEEDRSPTRETNRRTGGNCKASLWIHMGEKMSDGEDGEMFQWRWGYVHMQYQCETYLC